MLWCKLNDFTDSNSPYYVGLVGKMRHQSCKVLSFTALSLLIGLVYDRKI